VGTVAERLAEFGIELPPVAAPLAAYVPAVRAGSLVFTAGQLPLRDGTLLATGTVGLDVDVETAAACARQCALNALAAVDDVLGDAGVHARSAVGVSSLPLGAPVEVELVVQVAAGVVEAG